MNLNNKNSIKNSESIKALPEMKKIKRRNFFMYLGAGALGMFALKSLPFKLFQQKIKAETSIKIKANPYAVKRELNKNGAGKNTGGNLPGMKGKLNG